MLIDCPDCAVRYEIVDAELPPGRRTRCARCGRVWTPVADVARPGFEAAERTPQAIPVPPEASRPLPARSLPPLPRQDRSFPPIPVMPELPRRRAPFRTVGVLGLVVVLAIAFVVFRTQAEAAWPPITRLYGALGLG